MREVIGTIYHLCNSYEWVRNFEQKYVVEVQSENSGKFNYTECISDENKMNKKTKSLKCLLQEVHILLPVQFEISSARRPTFNCMLKASKNYVFCQFLILLSNGNGFVTVVFMKNLVARSSSDLPGKVQKRIFPIKNK